MKKTSLFILLVVSCLLSVNQLFAQADAIVGKWKTIDDETGKAKSIVKIFKATNNRYYGKIESLLNRKAGDENPSCTHCEVMDGKYKTSDGKVIGILFVRDLKFVEKDGEWTDGTIFDPNNGKEYSCSMKIKEGKLNVRGSLDSWGIVGRTQVWFPEK